MLRIGLVYIFMNTCITSPTLQKNTFHNYCDKFREDRLFLNHGKIIFFPNWQKQTLDDVVRRYKIPHTVLGAAHDQLLLR